MRRHAIIALVMLLGLPAAVPTAAAQPPVGIVRPAPDRAAKMTPLELGAQLFAGNCASCHGGDARGLNPAAAHRGVGAVQGAGPSLHGVGALAADFYLRTGYMPLGHPGDQPQRSPLLLHDPEIRALVKYIDSLGGGPPVPRVNPQEGDLGRGQRLFTEHCAGCHQVVGQGGVVTGGRVPNLQRATATQIAEAIRIGPYLMPRFSRKDLSDAQVRDIVRYVLSTRNPPDRGGWGIGNLGPFPEGMVTWLIAIVVLVATCVVIGSRGRS